MVAAGLEQHARAITQRVISLLSEDRAHFTKSYDDFQTMLAAIAIETQAGRKEASAGQEALIAGLRGLAQDLSVVSASVEGAIRGQKKLSRDVGALSKRMDASEEDRAQMRQEIEAIKRILAERPGQRAAEHQALLAAIRGTQSTDDGE